MYPVLAVLDELKRTLRQHSAVILQAPTGAGKSTVLPLELYNESWLNGGKIVMLEPRRLAARSVAMRMASLLGQEVGDIVGYRIRFETRVSRQTRIEVVTEGILTRMIQSDNTLDGIGMVIFDEFHERSLAADLALSLCIQVQQILRPELRILVMSATLESQALSRLFNKAPLVRCEGRQFPVEIFYDDQSPDEPIHNRVMRTIRKALREHAGDVLVFLPGYGDIRRTAELLEANSGEYSVRPLFGDLSYKKQQEAILPDPERKRKIILSTSIAETSLTIENISVVVDSGLSRVPQFDPGSGLTRLRTVRVTLDSAAQRAGRAGRLGPGFCYRLWSRSAQEFLLPHRTPEILEADLAPLLLELAAWGNPRPDELSWITPPPAGAVKQAHALLEQLGALHDDKVTEKGREMVKMPTHPRISHMLLEASREKITLALACDIAAILEEKDPLPIESGADLTLRIEALHRYRGDRRFNPTFDRVELLARSWRRMWRVEDALGPVDPATVGYLLSAAYPDRIAQQVSKHSDRYKLVNGRMVRLPLHDPLIHSPWLVAAHVDAREGEGKIFMAAPVNMDDLIHLTNEEESVEWDSSQGRIVAMQKKKLGSLTLESRTINKIPEHKRVELLCDVIRKNGMQLLDWDEDQRQRQARMMSLRIWRSDESWPDVSDEALLHDLEQWLAPSLAGVSRKEDLEKIKPFDVITGRLPWEVLSRVDRLAPRRMEVPSGSMIRISYFPDGRLPVMEVRLQEVFGWQEIPLINDGTVPLVLHLLSPAYRAVQVTQDLQSFWKNTYADVRKELRRRYPKHAWPEDPLTAQPVRGAKKRN